MIVQVIAENKPENKKLNAGRLGDYSQSKGGTLYWKREGVKVNQQELNMNPVLHFKR